MMRLVGGMVALTLAVGACATPTPAAPPVVATTSILGDVVGQVVDDSLPTVTLIPVGADPHDFRPSARQAGVVAGALLVVANGLGLEERLADLLSAAAADGTPVIEIGPLVDPLPFGVEAGPEAGLDPHVWLDPLRMAKAARLIAARLAELDPSTPAGTWTDRGERYAGELERLDGRIRDILSVVPPERRLLVTNHDALGYFADRYGFRIVGTVIPGGSTLAEPSSSELGELVRTIETTGVPAIFVETTTSADLATTLAAELGRPIEIVELYTGSLGEPGSGADSYVGMMETDARRIAAALGEGT